MSDTYTGSSEEDDGYGHFADPDDSDDNYVSPATVLARARASMGNTEAAAMAARDCPGDFI